MKPQVGQFLYASCSAQDYGKVLGVYKDLNDNNVIDIEVFDANDLIDSPFEDEMGPSLMRIELPIGVNAVLRAVLYKENEPIVEEYSITCNTPGDLCYRCTKLFWLHDLPSD